MKLLIQMYIVHNRHRVTWSFILFFGQKIHILHLNIFNFFKIQPNNGAFDLILEATLRAESPLIFLDKSGRGRRLCKWLRDCLIRSSAKKINKSVKFSDGQTSFSLMYMITRKNCWLFVCPCWVTMVTALLLHEVFEKAVKSMLQKVNISNMSSLNLPDTRSLFSFFVC